MAFFVPAQTPYTRVFAGDAAGYGLSVVSLLILLKTIPMPRRLRSPIAPHYRAHLKAGWTVMRSDRELQAILAVNTVGEAAFATFTVGAALLSTHNFHAGAVGYGALIGSYGVGNLDR